VPSADGLQTPEPQAEPPAAQKPAPRAPQPPAPRRRGDVNIQIELTISDQLGSGKPEPRVVSMLVADGAFGRIRSRGAEPAAVETLNVDARPEVIGNDRLALELTLEYVPPRAEGAPRRPAGLNEQLTVILQNGKPLLISQAADPLADRKTTVEVRATILK
jgi:hypothetical protein